MARTKQTARKTIGIKRPMRAQIPRRAMKKRNNIFNNKNNNQQQGIFSTIATPNIQNIQTPNHPPRFRPSVKTLKMIRVYPKSRIYKGKNIYKELPLNSLVLEGFLNDALDRYRKERGGDAVAVGVGDSARRVIITICRGIASNYIENKFGVVV